MSVKYQVFISSTYIDLKNERDQIIKSTLELGHIPVGMEMFSAADEEQWKIITRTIDECDYYVVIVAHRYGSETENISYTEKEYDYAISRNIPVLGFIIDDKATWPADCIDKNSVTVERLKSFKDKALLKPVSFWTNADDLATKYSIALIKAISHLPRPGWLRTTEVPSMNSYEEISRLSRENTELRTELSKQSKHHAEDDNANYSRTARLLSNNSIKIRISYAGYSRYEDGPAVSLFNIFALLAPEMMFDISTLKASQYLGQMLKPQRENRNVNRTYPIARNMMNSIFLDLNTLDLVRPYKREASPEGDQEYWQLTDFGRSLLSTYRKTVLTSGNDDS